MEAMIQALSSATSADDVETAISASTFDVNDCGGGDKAAHDAVKENLKNILEKVAENPALATTAKLRRRIKRFQQSLDAPPHAPVVETKSKPSYPEPVVVLHLSHEESINALIACRSYHDLNREMNNLCLPSVEQGGMKADSFSAYRIPMRDILKSHVAKDGMTNKVLRRRVTRLIFQLSTDAEQAQEVAAVKAKAVMAATRNLTAKKVREPREIQSKEMKTESNVPTHAPVPVLSKFECAKIITECISGIRSAKTPADIERVISALPASGYGDSETLRDLLTSILDNAELVNNAKLRRRVKRLIETLQASSTPAAAVSAAEVATSSTNESSYNKAPAASSSSQRDTIQPIQKEKAPPLRIPSVLTPVLPPAPTVRVITGSFSGSLTLLQAADTPVLVEEAIAELSVDSEGDEEAREAVRLKLEELFKNEGLVNNSKLRRRIKRLIEVLAPPGSNEPVVAETPVASDEVKKEVVKKEKKVKEPKVKKEDLKNPPAGPSLDSVILTATTMKTSEELSNALVEVTAESGSCASRRTLKRILERVLKDDSGLTGQMSAQNRRKFRRVADMLAPRPVTATPAAAVTPVAVSNQSTATIVKTEAASDDVAMTFL